jgi:hypothetical protein
VFEAFGLQKVKFGTEIIIIGRNGSKLNVSGVVLRNRFEHPSTFVAFMSFLLSLTFASGVFARAPVCVKLERQLASAGTSNPGKSERFSRAARAQGKQLQIARGQARGAGCGGSFFSAGNGTANKADCTRITSTIRRMEVNLSSLQNKANGGALRPNRSRILAALSANDCNGRVIDNIVVKRKQPVAKKPEAAGFFTILFGGSKQMKKVDTTYAVASEQKPTTKKQVTVISGGDSGLSNLDYAGGTFRTLCVRTCDGYYFPVSFSTTSSRFATDEKVCSTMCPGTPTKLYYHSMPDQEPEQMISLRQEPYTALPTAFQYRRDGVGAMPGCRCQAATAVRVGVASANSSNVMSKWIPYPSSKPDLLDDEETRLNRSGGLDADTIHELLEGKLSTQTLASQQKIRVVGPAFLPSRSKAIDLQVQGHLSVQ